ncbi:MAG: ATP cone domain-containing protein, partial [Planctomycetia bacterium]|nr:ATP cone domain-containing protein [Planctomycetia bacterium]
MHERTELMIVRGEKSLQYIVKRDGRIAQWDPERITRAVDKAMQACHMGTTEDAGKITQYVVQSLEQSGSDAMPDVEQVQDLVEEMLMRHGFASVAKKYILYRASRTRIREMNTGLMRIYDEITSTDAGESNLKRDNANVDGDTAMGTMLKYGCEGAKDYNEKYLLSSEQATAHHRG